MEWEFPMRGYFLCHYIYVALVQTKFTQVNYETKKQIAKIYI